MLDQSEVLPIIKRLKDNKISYALGGSGLLYYLGICDSVNDWDITVDCSKDKLISAISGYDWAEKKSGDYPFASQYRISIDSLIIDFIGYFAFQYKEEVINIPIYPCEKWGSINVSSPEVWYVAYYLMGRKEKADLILNYLKSNKKKINKDFIEDLVKQKGLISSEIIQNMRTLV